MSSDATHGEVDLSHLAALLNGAVGMELVARGYFNEAEMHVICAAIKAARSETGPNAEAANVVLALREQAVMSKYQTAEECKAARDALWQAAEALRFPPSATRENDDTKRLDFCEGRAATVYCSMTGHWVFVDERGKKHEERRGVLGPSIRGCIDAAMKGGK